MSVARHYDLNCRITQANSSNRYNKTQPIGIYFVVNYSLRMTVAENQKNYLVFSKINYLPMAR